MDSEQAEMIIKRLERIERLLSGEQICVCGHPKSEHYIPPGSMQRYPLCQHFFSNPPGSSPWQPLGQCACGTFVPKKDEV